MPSATPVGMSHSPQNTRFSRYKASSLASITLNAGTGRLSIRSISRPPYTMPLAPNMVSIRLIKMPKSVITGIKKPSAPFARIHSASKKLYMPERYSGSAAKSISAPMPPALPVLPRPKLSATSMARKSTFTRHHSLRMAFTFPCQLQKHGLQVRLAHNIRRGALFHKAPGLDDGNAVA